MHLEHSDFQKLAYKNMSLRERIIEIRDGKIGEINEYNEQRLNSLLEKWSYIVSSGKSEVFERRLAWDGINKNDCNKLFSNNRFESDLPLNKWMITLDEILKVSVSKDIALVGNFLEELNFEYDEDNSPFAEILTPFIYIAKNHIINQTNSYYNLISETSLINSLKGLLNWLILLSKETLDYEYSVFCLSNSSSLRNRINNSDNRRDNAVYSMFVNSFFQGKFYEFFLEYPVLSRLLSTSVDFWVESTKECIFHLASDRNDIISTFFFGQDFGQVTNFETNLSDRHQNGHSVIILTFSSGQKIVYKPRNIGMELAYNKLLEWINYKGDLLPFKTFDVLNRSSYGWAKFIVTEPCKNEEEVKKYYERCGLTICLVHILQSTDLHYENIISCGEYPVIIDLETILHPYAREESNFETTRSARSIAFQQRFKSVFRTAFHVFLDSEVGTDKLKISQEVIHQQIINGFHKMWQFLFRYRDELLKEGSPLYLLGEQRVRFVLRNTTTYFSIFKQSLKPNLLKDGLEYSLQFEGLWRAVLLFNADSHIWEIIKSEQEALEQMDIPIFYAEAKSDLLKISDNITIPKYFQQSGIESAIERLENLSEDELNQQINFMRGMLYTTKNKELHQLDHSKYIKIIGNPPKFSYLSIEDLIQGIKSIAVNLDINAHRSADGSVTWNAPQYDFTYHRWSYHPMNYDLFDGSSGVALFLAALEHTLGIRDYHDLILGSLFPLRKYINDCALTDTYLLTDTNNESLTIGGFRGIGSQIYSLVRISKFLQEPSLLEDAKKLAQHITPEIITNDKSYDVFSGSAGAILALLTLYTSSNELSTLNLAIVCGNHLLNHRRASESGLRAWATINGTLQTGFSHGAAGIAYALLKLYEVTKKTEFLEAAQEAIDFENSAFIPELNNWIDYRGVSNKDKRVCHCSWCNGAPGIGLARLTSLNILDNRQVRQDIASALNSTQQELSSEVDGLCCGVMGKLEFLFTASQKFSQPDLLPIVSSKMSEIVRDSVQRGYFFSASSLQFNPCFLQGDSGIGYELLRLLYSHLLPSVLMLE